jgi:hypothetical protein
MGYTGNAFDDMQFCLVRMNTRKDPLNHTDPYLTCSFIFLSYPPPPAPCAMAHHFGRYPELAGLVPPARA